MYKNASTSSFISDAAHVLSSKASHTASTCARYQVCLEMNLLHLNKDAHGISLSRFIQSTRGKFVAIFFSRFVIGQLGLITSTTSKAIFLVVRLSDLDGVNNRTGAVNISLDLQRLLIPCIVKLMRIPCKSERQGQQT